MKNFGLVIGRAKMTTFTTRARELLDAQPALSAAVEPLLKAREALGCQIADLDRKVLRLAQSAPQVRRFMTVPGVGPITALCYLATIDDPARFKKSRSVGAYVGLTTRRYASAKPIGQGAYPNAATRCCEAICMRLPMCCSRGSQGKHGACASQNAGG